MECYFIFVSSACRSNNLCHHDSRNKH